MYIKTHTEKININKKISVKVLCISSVFFYRNIRDFLQFITLYLIFYAFHRKSMLFFLDNYIITIFAYVLLNTTADLRSSSELKIYYPAKVEQVVL